MSLTLSGSGTIGGLVAGGLPDATVTNAELVTMDGAKVTGNIAAAQITSALNASGSAPVYACRAWVNFNGTGTVAIRASGNVSSITDNGTGDYTVNFTTAMPDANYAVTGSSHPTNVSDASYDRFVAIAAFSASACRAHVSGSAAVQVDTPIVCISVLR